MHDPTRFARLAATLSLCAAFASPAFSQPGLDGYSNYEAFAAQVKKLDESELVSVKPLARTLGGRDVLLVTVSRGAADKRPALLIVGNVHAPHLVGSELALRTVRQLLATEAHDVAAKSLLDRFALYVIPRPSPDATEACFQKPLTERTGNQRSTDDDRDFQSDEDPPQDLDGDAAIAQIRVEDESGKWMPHPADPRVLIEADPRKNERGRYTLHSEGIDDDDDGALNEDGPGGVSFNRNFTHHYPFFQAGAGPHQVSEIETRAVADFAFAHPNIALVLTFTPEDNLMDPWKPNPGAEGERIKSAILAADADYMNYVAEQYRTIHAGKDAPPSPKGEGSFSEWAYFHYGRWSLAARGWWIPKTPPPEGAKPSDEKRGSDDLNALYWLKKENISGFVDWKPIEHPDFPGRKVEVGGFRPFVRLNPPGGQLDELAGKHARFVARLGELMPKLSLGQVKVESQGAGVFRVTAKAVNSGYLPTMSAMGKLSGKAYPLQAKIELAPRMKLITGSLRMQLEPLAGNGGSAEAVWLLTVAEAQSRQLTVSVYSPSVGSDNKTVELK